MVDTMVSIPKFQYNDVLYYLVILPTDLHLI